MNGVIKSIVPEQMLSGVKALYWKLCNKFPKPSFSRKEHDALPALKCIVSYNRYGGYCVPESSRHRPAAQRVLAGEVYEAKTINFITSNCGSGDIVHAGTYFGDFLPALSQGCAPGAKIWAFEPNPESYRCAKITLEINGLKNVVFTNAGLGAEPGQLYIKTTDDDGSALGGASQIITDKSAEAAAMEVVEIVTIDDTVGVDREVSILQLDVEGHEKDALTGALKTIQRCLPIIILEVLPDSTLLGSDWFSENILQLGYRRLANIHENIIFVCDAKQ